MTQNFVFALFNNPAVCGPGASKVMAVSICILNPNLMIEVLHLFILVRSMQRSCHAVSRINQDNWDKQVGIQSRNGAQRVPTDGISNLGDPNL
jgi:hypothetical protein